MEGGSANDYDYCAGDPINCSDLSGEALVLYDARRPGYSPVEAEAQLSFIVCVLAPCEIQPTRFLDNYGRRPDLFWSTGRGGVIAEVKTGRLSQSPDLRAEADADAAIARDFGYTAVWHFYPNRQGQVGLTQGLENYLHSRGINVVVHKFPQNRSRSRCIIGCILS